MSNAPYLLKGARWGYRMGNAEAVDSMLHEGLTCSINGCHMGMTAEEVAKRFGVSRADQDAFAAESQARAETAIASGVFDREIVPVEVPQKKGAPRRGLARRVSARRDDGREAGGAASRLHEGRHGDGRQRVGHQRRRRGAGGGDRARGPTKNGRTPLATILLVLHDRRRSDDHGDGAGRGDAARGEARRPHARRPRRRSS